MYIEAERYIETVESDSLLIRNLEKYKGRQVEVIILPFDKKVIEEKTTQINTPKKSLFGTLNKYADPELRKQEDSAWELAVKEKYGNH